MTWKLQSRLERHRVSEFCVTRYAADRGCGFAERQHCIGNETFTFDTAGNALYLECKREARTAHRGDPHRTDKAIAQTDEWLRQVQS